MIVRRPLRAPAEDGALLIDPPLEQVASLLAENRRRLASGPDILGRPWSELRRLARAEVKDAARAYFTRVGDPFPPFESDSLILAGHQPELVHPGVWVKNFALNGLARRHGATPLNLIIDYDTVKPTLLQLPESSSRSLAPVQVRSLSFDSWVGACTYEELELPSPDALDFVLERSRTAWQSWDFQPLLPAFWSDIGHKAQSLRLVGSCFAAARRLLERRWGCHNWEASVSDLCGTTAFALFVYHILSELPSFHRVYNECVHEYRRINGLRSRNHPVPDLVVEGDWREVPFWAWRKGARFRGRLFARRTQQDIELRAVPWMPGLPEPIISLSLPTLLEEWECLEAEGFKVRPRAITNTLFARLFVGDLFIHGIGGAKYDELTDEIIRRFYGIEPPRYLVVSGTLRLPLPTLPATEEQRHALMQQLRSVRWNPHRHLSDEVARTAEVRQLLVQREQCVHRQPDTRRGRRERYAALRNLTEQLRPYVNDEATRLQQELAQCERDLAANAVLGRRDYAACLYPESLLRSFLTRVL